MAVLTKPLLAEGGPASVFRSFLLGVCILRAEPSAKGAHTSSGATNTFLPPHNYLTTQFWRENLNKTSDYFLLYLTTSIFQPNPSKPESVKETTKKPQSSADYSPIKPLLLCSGSPSKSQPGTSSHLLQAHSSSTFFHLPKSKIEAEEEP